MNQIYKFNAEHFTRPQTVKLVRDLEAEGVEVEYASMDPVFSNEATIIVTCTDAVAKSIKNRMWAINNGAYCEMLQIDQDHLNQLVGE